MIILRRRIALVVSLASSLTLLLGAQAFAAVNVSVDGNQFGSDLDINDATNGDDVLNVSVSGNTITVTQSGANGLATADAADCTVISANARIDCLLQPVNPAPPAAPFTTVQFVDLDLNNGTDSFTNQNLDAQVSENDGDATGNKTISSGPGDDSVSTGSGNDVIDTGSGDNEVESGAGDDTVIGGPGEDDVNPGLGSDTVFTAGGEDDIDEERSFSDGPDVLDGGDGNFDEIEYDNGGVATGVTITINGQPDDGHPGEGDNVLGMEELNGTDGNDLIAGSDAPDDVGAGEGDDLITTAGGDDFIAGDDGNDSIDAGSGGDSVGGGFAANGADTLAGGPGGDELDYCCDLEPVSVTPNGQPDDGRPLEGDNVSGFEGLIGGDGPDTLVGDDSSNELTGMGGDDLLVGAGGNDEFFGDHGGDGDGDPGGDDTINALGGRDEVHCELGFDTLAADAEDQIGPGCERHGAEIASESARVNGKKAKVRVSCGEEEGFACEGKAALVSNGKTLGKGKYDIDNGEDKNVTVKLSKKGRKALSGKGKLLVSAEARTEEPPGVTTNAADLLLTRG